MILVFPQASKTFNLFYRDIRLSSKGLENYVSMITKAYDSKYIDEILLIVLESFAYKNELNQVFKKNFPQAKVNILVLIRETQGSMCTLLMAINKLKNQSVLISSLDQMLLGPQLDIDLFVNEDCDIQVPIFLSDKPFFSYILRDDENQVIQVIEKRVISNEAIMGFYFIKNFSDFFDEAIKLLEKYKGFRERIFFISDVINSFLISKKTVSFPKFFSQDYYKLKNISEFEMVIKK